LAREGLQARLACLSRRRLTTVVAGAGFGKSTLVAEWARATDSAWYGLDARDASLPVFARGLGDALRLDLGRPERLALETGRGQSGDEQARAESLAGMICEALETRDDDLTALVLDDVQELEGATASARLIEAVCRQAPAGFHLVLCSRLDPPFPIERLRGRGQVGEIDASMLSFSLEEIAALLAPATGAPPADLAAIVLDVTAGWPAAVRLAVDVLGAAEPSESDRVLERLRRPEGPLFSYLAEEVFSGLRPAVRELLRRAAHFHRVTPALCEAIGVSNAERDLARLARQGLFVERSSDADRAFSLHDLLREFVQRRWPFDAADLRELEARAANWFESEGRLAEALVSMIATGDRAAIERFLRRRNSELLPTGAESVIQAGRLLPESSRGDVAIEMLLGDAHLNRGDRQQALACFERAAEDAEPLPPGLALRLGIVYHESDPARAIREYARGHVDRGDTADEALLLAFTSNAHFYLGHGDACRAYAERALETAVASGSPAALAHAHHALALLASLNGDVKEAEHEFRQDLTAAEEAAEIEQLVRAQSNLAANLCNQGRHREALHEAESALRLAELHGVAMVFRALVLSNRGRANWGLGNPEQATADLEAARELYERLESSFVVVALGALGDVYRDRGDLALARASYEDALAESERTGTFQGRREILVGLARLLAFDEPEEAENLIGRALAMEPSTHRLSALLGAGWVALARGQGARATEFGDAALTEARACRDRSGIAESLELQALSADGSERALGRLREAAAIWRRIGNELAASRSELVLAHVRGAGAAEGADAERRLANHGVTVSTAAAAAGPLAVLGRRSIQPIAIQTLGRFTVFRDRRPIALSEWQSRKARDLLKILVARRGQPTPREMLIEWLWPEQDPQRTRHRLTVAVSTLRAVLDPARQSGLERYVAGKDALRLELSEVEVDVEHFLGDATRALDRQTKGRLAEAQPFLEAAKAAYAGEFLEEDQYEDWAIPLREEVRAIYQSVLRALAESATAVADYDAAARYHLRLLERDPHDEDAHLALVSTLVRAGHHGEARRRYHAYVNRMDELGIEPAPYPR
jgi:ATP/maltotriose-dependent transcriptional regulator MalT/DNA-binding SARP family transcriptional activator